MAQEHLLTYDDLLRIVELIKSSEHFSEFRLKVGDIEVEVKRRAAASARDAISRASQAAVGPEGEPPDCGPAQASLAATRSSREASAATRSDDRATRAAGQTPAPQPARGRAATESLAPDAIIVRAPMVGTFYRAPAPGAPPFVDIGQAVDADTTVCIIEVMKLMNSIPAGRRGVVTHILVDDGQPVDAHAPLIVLDAAARPD